MRNLRNMERHLTSIKCSRFSIKSKQDWEISKWTNLISNQKAQEDIKQQLQCQKEVVIIQNFQTNFLIPIVKNQMKKLIDNQL